MEAGTAWVVIGILLLIAEIFIPGFTVAVFGLACLAASVPAFLHWSLNYQLATFAAATAVLFVTVRPVVMRYLDRVSPPVRTNVDALVGKTGVVLQRIDPTTHTGRVAVEGDDWRALAADGKAIEPGSRVRVERVDGTKLYVRPQA